MITFLPCSLVQSKFAISSVRTSLFQIKMQSFVGLIFIMCISVAFSANCEPDTCEQGKTCCPTSIHNVYTCCPYQDAVCCRDHLHCCPRGTVCDSESESCFPKMRDAKRRELNLLEKRQGVPPEERPLYQNRCNDESYCPYGSTCCKSVDGSYGCCPHNHATCCPDQIHCCPQGGKCDVTSEYCISGYITYPSDTKEQTFAIDDESLI